MSVTSDRPENHAACGADTARPRAHRSRQRNKEKAHALGLTSATGLVIGSIVGTGVFTMPAVLAGAGTMGIVVLGVIAVGAMLLAMLFGQLTRRVPEQRRWALRVLPARVRRFRRLPRRVVLLDPVLGRQCGHRLLVGLLRGRPVRLGPRIHRYGELGHRHGGPVGARHHQPGGDPPDGLVPERHRGPQVPSPLFVGVVGWFFVQSAHFGPFNASGGSLYSGIGIAAGVALFSFIGVEAAAITAKRVKNPRINVGRASLLGTALSAVLYVLVTAAVMGLVAHHALVNNGSPFVNAFQSIFPHEAWAGRFIAAIAVISGIGALNGWTLIVTETSRAIAQDDMFPRPFAWKDRKGTAWFGILVGTALPSLLMLWRYTTSSGLTVFTYLVDLTVVTVAIPYFMSAIAQLTYLVSRRRRVQGWLLARDLSVAGASVLFSMWVTFASGIPGRLPGPGRDHGRAHPVRLLERPTGAPR